MRATSKQTARLESARPDSTTHQRVAQAGRQTGTGRAGAGHPGNQSNDAIMALRILAQTYEQVGDNLLERLHGCAGDRRAARSISRHLDWVGARAQVINSFIQAGDGALSYLCAATDTPERLASLVQLTARNAAAPERLPVALFLMEKIDEELHLA
ncbi:MAG: hypothetical protein JNL25_02260 [Rhodospirillaceae bacterium]|nr:hypothetical protein [Rhodospirillaceae bacterium]